MKQPIFGNVPLRLLSVKQNLIPTRYKREKMPFTPFHMGAALIVKPVFKRYFSLMTFGIAQVVMDIEPGIRMATGMDILHGPTHTILGALVIAFLVTMIAPGICNLVLTKWNKEMTFYAWPWLLSLSRVSKAAIITGAFFGTLSHVALDSLMHHDIHPLSPFSRDNPFAGLVTNDGVYQACTIAGVVGILVWLIIKWFDHAPKAVVTGIAPTSVRIDIPKEWATRWVKELRFTWLGVLLLSVVPAVLYGAAVLSVGVLAFAVLVVFPAVVLGPWIAKGSVRRNFRRLCVMLAVPCLTLAYVGEVDKRISENALPLTQAIESFQRETGHYPESLDDLLPKHLIKLPDVRFSVSQPPITYRVTDGKPYLSIPSAMGDMFAIYEYNFETEAWVHYD